MLKRLNKPVTHISESVRMPSESMQAIVKSESNPSFWQCSQANHRNVSKPSMLYTTAILFFWVAHLKLVSHQSSQ